MNAKTLVIPQFNIRTYYHYCKVTGSLVLVWTWFPLFLIILKIKEKIKIKRKTKKTN